VYAADLIADREEDENTSSYLSGLTDEDIHKGIEDLLEAGWIKHFVFANKDKKKWKDLTDEEQTTITKAHECDTWIEYYGVYDWTGLSNNNFTMKDDMVYRTRPR